MTGPLAVHRPPDSQRRASPAAAPPLGIDGGLLRLHHRQRLAVVAPQDVVGIADALLVGHASDFVFAVPFLIQRPAGALQSEVDDELAGLVLVPVVGLGDGLVLRLDGRELFTQCFQLALNFFAGFLRCIPLRFEGLQLLAAGLGIGCRSTLGMKDSSKALSLAGSYLPPCAGRCGPPSR